MCAPVTMRASSGGSTSASATGVNSVGRIDSDEPSACRSTIQNFSAPVSGSAWVTDTVGLRGPPSPQPMSQSPPSSFST